jgi:hypothetical protein
VRALATFDADVCVCLARIALHSPLRCTASHTGTVIALSGDLSPLYATAVLFVIGPRIDDTGKSVCWTFTKLIQGVTLISLIPETYSA